MDAHDWLRRHLDARHALGEPVEFEPCDDPALARFAALVPDDVVEMDANRDDVHYLRYGTRMQLTVSLLAAGATEPQVSRRTWAPGQGPPSAGFITAGATPHGAAASPVGPVTEACLLLVSTPFAHFSAERRPDGLLVRGARRTAANTYDYLELARTERGAQDR